jgi:hypothetical protein
MVRLQTAARDGTRPPCTSQGSGHPLQQRDGMLLLLDGFLTLLCRVCADLSTVVTILPTLLHSRDALVWNLGL